MKPFRLASVAKLRQMEEDRAAAELLTRTQRRRGAEQRAQHLRAALETTTLPTEADALSFRAAVAARAAASAALTEAATAVELTRSEEQGAQGAWSRARRRTTTIGKLAEKHVLAERAAESHAEQLHLDEIATQRATTHDEGAQA